MKSSSNHFAKLGGKLKSPHEVSAHAKDQNREKLAYKREVLPILSLSLL